MRRPPPRTRRGQSNPGSGFPIPIEAAGSVPEFPTSCGAGIWLLYSRGRRLRAVPRDGRCRLHRGDGARRNSRRTRRISFIRMIRLLPPSASAVTARGERPRTEVHLHDPRGTTCATQPNKELRSLSENDLALASKEHRAGEQSFGKTSRRHGKARKSDLMGRGDVVGRVSNRDWVARSAPKPGARPRNDDTERLRIDGAATAKTT